MRLYIAALGSHFDLVNPDAIRQFIEDKSISLSENVYEAVTRMNIYVLESFLTVKKWQVEFYQKGIFKDLMLDSGGFTFIKGKKRMDWEDYVDKYGDFVRELGIRHYFEVDVYDIIGVKETIKLRERLEKRVGWRSIPVWHPSCRVDFFDNLLEDYDYVAIAGLTTKKTPVKILPTLINKAHSKGVKVHGLGFTSGLHLTKFKFDSVDSQTWLAAANRRMICKFYGSQIAQFVVKSKGRINGSHLRQYNYLSWVGYQLYLENIS